jgi:hypothetical protein
MQEKRIAMQITTKSIALLSLIPLALACNEQGGSEMSRSPSIRAASSKAAVQKLEDTEYEAPQVMLRALAQEEIVGAAQKMYSVFGSADGASVAGVNTEPSLNPPSELGPGKFTVVHFKGKAGVSVRHNSETDELEVVDTGVRANHGPNQKYSSDPSTLRSIFDKAYSQLSASGLFSSSTVSLTDTVAIPVTEGQGRSDQSPSTWVGGYRFFVPFKIQGIPVRDSEHRDLGLTVDVHASGAVSLVKTRGGLLMQAGSSAVAEGARVSRVFLPEAADTLVASSHSGRKVTPVGMVYVVDSRKVKQVLVPQQAYRVQPEFVFNGRTVGGKISWTTVAVNDPKQTLSTWPTIDLNSPAAKGDPR